MSSIVLFLLAPQAAASTCLRCFGGGAGVYILCLKIISIFIGQMRDSVAASVIAGSGVVRAVHLLRITTY